MRQADPIVDISTKTTMTRTFLCNLELLLGCNMHWWILQFWVNLNSSWCKASNDHNFLPLQTPACFLSMIFSCSLELTVDWICFWFASTNWFLIHTIQIHIPKIDWKPKRFVLDIGFCFRYSPIEHVYSSKVQNIRHISLWNRKWWIFVHRQDLLFGK